jgi:hypothetical protein
MSKTYELYDANENTLLQSADYSEINAYLSKNQLNGFSVWEGKLDDDGEFEAERRVTFMYERPDDPRVAEHVGYHVPEDTPSLGDPWWATR